MNKLQQDLHELLSILLECANPNALVPIAASIIFDDSQQAESHPGQTAAFPQANP